jgi:uncharacterized protein (DUF927 family)
MYTYKENLQKLFDKQMTRKEFLAHIGAAILIVIGVKGIMDHLVSRTEPGKSKSDQGYSSGAYGG